MQDIGLALSNIMSDKQCSSIYAFFLLSEKKEGDKNGIYKLQSESDKETCRRLRDTRNI